MREFQVSELTGNEILAKPVCLEDGQVILEAGTVLKLSYKESLTLLNIRKIYIEDSFEKYEKTNCYFDKEVLLDFQNQLREILSHHIYKDNRGLKKLTELADKMVTAFEETREVRALDIRNRTSDLYEHTIYTTLLVMILGKEYRFSRERMVGAVLGCLRHDLGYRYVNVDYENCCEEDMNPMELYEMKKHTILGYTALEREDWIPKISKMMILSHHEKMDGSGYPLKQQNNEAECRMIQICDTFDCTVSGMECLRKSITEAFHIISDGEKYEIRMAETLKKKVGIYPVGTILKMDNGKDAVVISQTENAQAPVILYTEESDEKRVISENLNRKNAPKILEVR